MMTPAYACFIYILDGKFFYEVETEVMGFSIPGRLAQGQDDHLCLLRQIQDTKMSIRRNPSLSSIDNTSGVSFVSRSSIGRCELGGYIINFDQKLIIMDVYAWWNGEPKEIGGMDISHFRDHPYLQRILTGILREFWPGWEIAWTKNQDLEDFILGKINYDQLPLLQNDLTETDHLLAVPSHLIEEVFKRGIASF